MQGKEYTCCEYLRMYSHYSALLSHMKMLSLTCTGSAFTSNKGVHTIKLKSAADRQVHTLQVRTSRNGQLHMAGQQTSASRLLPESLHFTQGADTELYAPHQCDSTILAQYPHGGLSQVPPCSPSPDVSTPPSPSFPSSSILVFFISFAAHQRI